MRIRVIQDKCVGHARCAAVAPHIFVLDEDGYLRTLDREVPSEAEDLAKRGARACPEGAIEISEG